MYIHPFTSQSRQFLFSVVQVRNQKNILSYKK